MHWSKPFTMIEAHAEGEIGRVVTEGMPDIPGPTMADKLEFMNADGDSLRRYLVQEPRGFAQMSTILLPPSTRDDADVGFIVLQGDKAHAMSGSNCICAATVLLETGMIRMREPETTIVFDTAAGLISARAHCREGKCVRVELEMSPCYVDRMDAQVEVDGFGKARLSIAFGGVFYALIDAEQFGLAINSESARLLVEAGSRTHRAVNRQLEIAHPEVPGLTGLSYVMFTGYDDERNLKNATIMPPGRVDRSPCGTGTSARLALMHARGEADIGDSFVARSIIDSEFQAKLISDARVCGRAAVIPGISGRGWMHGMRQIGIDPSDPYQEGYVVSDCWGDAFDLLN